MANLYLSGHQALKGYEERVYQYTQFRLLSAHGAYLNAGRKWLRDFQLYRDTKDVELMLDSGAFTVWTKEEPDIKVHELLATYTRVLRNLGHKFKQIWFINLDKIPGKLHRAPTQEEVTEAIRISDENFRVLTAELGLRVLPVFHRSESEQRLKEVLDLNPRYVCISPKTDGAERYRREWSQRVLALCGKVKAHGLAATGSLMLSSVPWHSVDSSSWVQVCAFGGIMIPNNGGFSILPVSEHSTKRRNFGQHIDSIGKEILRIVEEICDVLRLTVAELRTRDGARALFNVYVSYEIATKSYRVTPIQTTLLEL